MFFMKGTYFALARCLYRGTQNPRLSLGELRRDNRGAGKARGGLLFMPDLRGEEVPPAVARCAAVPEEVAWG